MRKTLLRALLLTLLTTRAMADYSNTVVSLNPLGYWRLNETNPPPADVASNSGTLGASANGLYVSAATHPTPGALANGTGTAAFFPGTNGNRVTVPYQPVLAAAAPFSVEFWANPASVSGTMCVASLVQFGNLGNGDSTREGWLFYQTGASGWIFRTYGTGNTAYPATASQTVNVGQWYHVVGVYDGTNNTLYVNGQVAATVPAPSFVPVPANASPFTVGSRAYGNLGFFSYDGSVDEVAYYTNILSAADVLAHYQNGTSASPATPYSQLVEAKAPPLYLHLDEPAFTAADPSTYPVAVNLGSDGADINGAYDPGTIPGVPGVPYLGFDTNNFATAFGPEQGGEINLGLSEALDFTGPFSVVLWFKTGPTDARFQSFIGKSDTSWRGGIDGSGFPRFALGNNNSDVIGTADLNDGLWHQYAGVYDGTNLYLYIDGTLNNLEDNVNPVAGDSSNPVLIGAVGDYGDGRVFKGSLDEVAAFTNALTAAQIQQLYFAAEAPPIITQQPTSPITANEGTSTTFSGEAYGAGKLAYQWQFNGTNLTGQTTSNLVLTAVQISQSGNYTLVVTNVYGAVTSSVVALTVQAGPPNIQSNPSSTIRYTGGSANFSVTANGSAPLAYQWQFNGSALSGQTGTNLTLSNLQNAQVGNYSVAISNPHGAVTSSIVTLTLVAAPTSPYAQSVLADGPISYWRLGETNGITAFDYVGGNNGSYTNVLLGQPGYSAYDTNTAVKFGPQDDSLVGNIPNIDFATNTGVRSFSLECWLNAPPQISDSAIITKGTGGGGEQFDIDFGATGHAIRFLYRDASGAVVLLNSGVVPDGNWHHIVAVVDGPNLLASIYVDGNQTASATITPTGILASHQSMTIGSRQSGSTAFDDQLDGVVDEVAVYGTALTAQQVLNHFNAQYPASVPPAISVQPVSTTNYASLTATFTVVASGTSLSYQWLSNSVPISGASSATLTLSPLDYPDTAGYQVEVQNSYGAITSSIANLTILTPPTTLDLTSGLVLHLTFDNTYQDSSGRNNNGTNEGATTFVSDGELGSALHYFTDPSVPTYNYVTLGNRPDLNFSSNVNFTVSYWVRMQAGEEIGDLPFICNAIGSTFSPGYTFAPSYQQGGWAWSLNGVGLYGAQGSINDGNWHHLVHTFDRSSYGITYLDGVPVSSYEDATVGDISQTTPTSIGQDPTGTYGETGSADIDDIGIWRRELSPLEVSSIYAGATVHGVTFGTAIATPTLSIAPSGGKIQVSWTGTATLQAAGSLTGTFTNVTGAASPYLVTPTNSQTFFRLSIP